MVQTGKALQEESRWYLAERGKVEASMLKLMEDQPELFRNGVVLTERQRAVFTDMMQGFGTIERTVPELPMSLKGASLGLVTIAFLCGQTEDIHAVGTLLEMANHDDSPFLQKLNRPGNRRFTPCPTANQEVIADALDRILVATATRPGGDTDSVKVAKEYLQWREQAGLSERNIVRVFAYGEPVTPYGLLGTVRRPPSNAKTMELALPMMERGRATRGPSDDMAQKVKTVLLWAKRIGVVPSSPH